MIGRGYRIAASAVFLLLAAILASGYFQNFDFDILAGAGFFAVLGALPLLDPKRPGRAGSLVALGFAAAFVHHSLAILTGTITLPGKCGGKALFCNLENYLYGIGGHPAASAPFLALAILAAYIGIRAWPRHEAAPP